jgi:hypothetical protein
MFLGFFVLPQHLCAQQAKPSVPLEIPVAEVLRCTQLDLPPAAPDGRMQSWEFRVGSWETESSPEKRQRGRKITLSADSVGRPLLLVEEAWQGELRVVVIMHGIAADSTASIWQEVAIDSVALARAVEAEDSEGVRAASRLLPHRLLNASERDRADRLATWLLARRCARPN